MKWKRLAYYLMINVLVSVCSILAVLYFWERSQSLAPGSGVLSVRSGATAGGTPVAGTPTASGVSSTAAPVGTPTPEYIVYQVQEGDTFEDIAKKYGVSVDQLMAANGFTEAITLGAGEVLQIPLALQEESAVAITNVIGPGDIGSERVIIRHTSEGSLSLAGWRLEDEDGNQFTFPALELVTDGATVGVFTKSGTNSAESVFWGLDRAIWQTGETVTLLDQQGVERATYHVP